MAEMIGLIAGAIMTPAFIVQAVKLFRTKSAKDISLIFSIMILIGFTLWFVYGVSIGSLPVIMWNAIGAITAFFVLCAKLWYG